MEEEKKSWKIWDRLLNIIGTVDWSTSEQAPSAPLMENEEADNSPHSYLKNTLTLTIVYCLWRSIIFVRVISSICREHLVWGRFQFITGFAAKRPSRGRFKIASILLEGNKPGSVPFFFTRDTRRFVSGICTWISYTVQSKQSNIAERVSCSAGLDDIKQGQFEKHPRIDSCLCPKSGKVRPASKRTRRLLCLARRTSVKWARKLFQKNASKIW